MDKLMEQALLENKIVRYIPHFVKVMQTYKRLLDEAEQQVKTCNKPAVSVNEVVVCPRCKSKEVSIKPVTYDCYECGATWQTER